MNDANRQPASMTEPRPVHAWRWLFHCLRGGLDGAIASLVRGAPGASGADFERADAVPEALRAFRPHAPPARSFQPAPPRAALSVAALAAELEVVERLELARVLRALSCRHARRALRHASAAPSADLERDLERDEDPAARRRLERGEAAAGGRDSVAKLRARACAWLRAQRCNPACATGPRSACGPLGPLESQSSARFALRAARAALRLDPSLESELSVAWATWARGSRRPAARRFASVAMRASAGRVRECAQRAARICDAAEAGTRSVPGT